MRHSRRDHADRLHRRHVQQHEAPQAARHAGNQAGAQQPVLGGLDADIPQAAAAAQRLQQQPAQRGHASVGAFQLFEGCAVDVEDLQTRCTCELW